MSREDFARKIHWGSIVWITGIVNVGEMLPQLFKLWETRVTEGLSVSMFTLYFVIQIAFCLEGFFKRNNMLFVCMGLSSSVTLSVIMSCLYMR